MEEFTTLGETPVEITFVGVKDDQPTVAPAGGIVIEILPELIEAFDPLVEATTPLPV